MNLTELKTKYNLSRYYISKLIDDGYLTVMNSDYTVVKPFDLEKYKKQKTKERLEKSSKAHKLLWLNKTEEEKQKHYSLVSKGTLIGQSKMTEEKKSLWHKNVAKARKLWWSTLTSEDKKDIYAKIAIKMKEHFSNETFRNFHRLRTQEETLKVFSERNLEIQEKRRKALKANGSFGKSKVADACKQWLRQLGLVIEEEKEYPGMPKLHCDVYIENFDLWIELHFCKFHNGKPFDNTNPAHVQELAILKEKKTSFYDSIVYHWSYEDVLRKQCAEKNNLNWITFYSTRDFDNFFYSLGYEDIEVENV